MAKTRLNLILIPLLTLAVVGSGNRNSRADRSSGVASVEDTPIPLMDMGEATYFGFEGGLYPRGANAMPPGHASAGLEKAIRIQPLDAKGDPDPGGKYILLSIGMSNTTQEFCSPDSPDGVSCLPWTFMGEAAEDPKVNHSHLVIVNGAKANQSAGTWVSPNDQNYERIRLEILHPLGLSEKQVQIVWLKVANFELENSPSLPMDDADAYLLEDRMGDIARALKVRYPNLQQVFVSSRIYAGYATTSLNPEPYAYESGFSVKWLIEAQIQQMQTGEIDGLVGDLNYDTVAPWLAWGPYLWADGLTPRSDGLIWSMDDFEADGTHPSKSGETKVAGMLLDFFKTSPNTSCWFLSGGTCTIPVYLPLVQR